MPFVSSVVTVIVSELELMAVTVGVEATTLYAEAQAYRARCRGEIARLFADHDILLAPATPCAAPLSADPRIEIDGALSPARADLGIHTQPISFLGLPSLAVPLRRPGRLPLGLQLIGRPGSEPVLFAYAERLEAQGVTGISAPLFEEDTP